jgi:hypothetical protein
MKKRIYHPGLKPHCRSILTCPCCGRQIKGDLWTHHIKACAPRPHLGRLPK